MKEDCTDHLANKYPVSIKGIVLCDGKIPLLKNEREEYELPGGKLENDEQPVECVVREIKEELSIEVMPIAIVDSWLYTINNNTRVVIVTYGCIMTSNSDSLSLSNEHRELFLASLDGIHLINMPDGYKNSIIKWFQMAMHRMILR